jgi:nucleotide-binding universal stress UspA family protein
MIQIRSILHPTDFSPCSEHAFQLACSLARDYSASLLVLHVMERPIATYPGLAMAPPPPPPNFEERRIWEERLSKIQPADAKIRVTHRLEEGDPATAILEVAAESQCDLIVLGTHGRTGIGRLLMGSVAEKVVRSASCPVVTLKMPPATARESLASEVAKALGTPAT